MTVTYIIFDSRDMEDNPIPGEESALARIRELRNNELVLQIGSSDSEPDEINPEQLVDALYHMSDDPTVVVSGAIRCCEPADWYLRNLSEAGINMGYDETGCV